MAIVLAVQALWVTKARKVNKVYRAYLVTKARKVNQVRTALLVHKGP
jgi:hypothetical protein